MFELTLFGRLMQALYRKYEKLHIPLSESILPRNNFPRDFIPLFFCRLHFNSTAVKRNGNEYCGKQRFLGEKVLLLSS